MPHGTRPPQMALIIGHFERDLEQVDGKLEGAATVHGVATENSLFLPQSPCQQSFNLFTQGQLVSWVGMPNGM